MPGNLLVAGQDLYWTETRPAEGGRQALVGWDGHEVADRTPADFNTRTRVHEYGGAPFTVVDDRVLASRWEDQRLYRIGRGRPRPVTREPDVPAGVRWADGRATGDGRWLVAVRETHEDGAQPRNEVVAVDLADGTEHALVRGRDFVAAPRLSPDDRQLAWLAWDHPYMPWDSAELWVADFADGRLGTPRHVAGSETSSVCSLVWMPDGRLAFSQDASGYWEVHVRDGDRTERVSWFDADCGSPAWQFGSQSIASLEDGRLACVLTERATHRLVLLDPDGDDVVEVSLPYTWLDRIQAYGQGVTFLAGQANGTRAVVVWTPGSPAIEVRRFTLPNLSDDDCPVPEPIEVGTPDGETTHAFLWRPTNHAVEAPEDEQPPLVVFTHGGPTANVYPILNASIAYWTTRGFAVADVNYRGSTGFGRAYRDQLLGRWGELDVMDTIAVARGLATNGVVDADRMAIRGGSAGGYTTLAVLTTPGHPFACGASFFGVADLELLAEHTHKFESRYLDRVVGPLPESRQLYVDRSPLHRAELLSRPILLLQGLEDEVVPPQQAEAMVAAAARQGVPHAYLAFEGEQHGFRRASNIVTWLESELAFYGQVMGFEPAGELPEVELVGG
jgi:dipeptidyl aminopeptidase/acylaminoacyl peptidase